MTRPEKLQEGSRRVVIAVLAMACPTVFIGMKLLEGFGRALVALSLYGIGGPQLGELGGGLAEFYAASNPLRLALFLAGLVAMYVLAGSLLFYGKEGLRRRSLLWWAVLGLLGLLVLAGIGGMHIPVVDAGSNTEAFFNHLGDSQAGAAILIPAIVALFLERGIRPDQPLRPRIVLNGFGLIAVFFAGLVAAAQLAGGSEGRLHIPGRTHWTLDRMACGATDVVVGVARDFERIREPGCIYFDDRRPGEGPNVLARCEALQFKVDVMDQIWPLPAQRARVERVRTFRQGGVRGDAEQLIRDLSIVRDPSGNPPRIGPRIFHGIASQENGVSILRNTSPFGILVTDISTGELPHVADSTIANCSEKKAAAAAVRRACDWDLAFVGVAKSFRLIPRGEKAKEAYEFHAFDEWREAPEPHKDDAALLERGDAVEVELEVREKLDFQNPIPSAPLFIRVKAPKPVQFKLMRTAWFRSGRPEHIVFFAREDVVEPGLLHLVGHPETYRQGRQRLQRCLEARAAFDGSTAPAIPPDPPTATAKYYALWKDQADKALDRICAARTLDERVDAVQIQTIVDVDGKIEKVKVTKPSGNGKFDEAVVETLAKMNGLPPMTTEMSKQVAAPNKFGGMMLSERVMAKRWPCNP